MQAAFTLRCFFSVHLSLLCNINIVDFSFKFQIVLGMKQHIYATEYFAVPYYPFTSVFPCNAHGVFVMF